MKQILFIFFLAGLVASIGCSEKTPEKGIAAMEMGDYKTALKELDPLAEKGSAVAQHKIATMLNDGLGIDKDTASAFLLFQKAALQGYGASQHNLAIMYATGDATTKNDKLAFHWAEKAANQGNAESQILLSKFYINGTGTPKNHQIGVQLAEKAADQGLPEAFMWLCNLYGNGIGIPAPADYTKALKWCEKAALTGDAEAQFITSSLFYLDGKESLFVDWLEKAILQNHPQALYVGGTYYIAPAKGNTQKGFKLLERAAKNGHPEAQYSLGLHLIETKQDEKARRWIESAANQGVAAAQNRLGVILANQPAPDYLTSIEWYSKAVNQGYLLAYRNLANMYIQGLGTKKNTQKGMELLNLAAEQGGVDAQSYLGSIYYEGELTSKKYTEALKWYEKAATQGDAYAQYSLGFMYEHGQGTKKNTRHAADWYQKAATQGEPNATKALQERFPEQVIEQQTGWNTVKKQAQERCAKIFDSYSLLEICLENEKEAFLRLHNTN